ncbi:MAG: 16S rRNA (guanine(527)-N(7))-methyltransferase RsmG, partial [Bacteroidota bacterium]
MSEKILKYFPNLSDDQKNKIKSLEDIYKFWNAQINVISRKDFDEFYLRHVLHSLSIAMKFKFTPGTKIMDLGTGGGFPGIPLAIFYPDVHFLLTDSIGKKIKVVNEVAASLNLQNLTAAHSRSEDIKEKFDFIVTRAVAEFDQLIKWTRNKFSKEEKNSNLNGLICLKGGDLEQELSNYKSKVEIHNITDFFEETFFETKKIIYLSANN